MSTGILLMKLCLICDRKVHDSFLGDLVISRLPDYQKANALFYTR